MRSDMVSLVNQAVAQNKRVYVLVNNRSEAVASDRSSIGVSPWRMTFWFLKNNCAPIARLQVKG
jgi:hypothetical protein